MRESADAFTYEPVLPLGTTILVVDDEETIGDIISEYLRDEGFQVLVARDGSEALRLAYEVHPHVIISDVLMPHLDGYGLLERVRQSPEIANTPLILMSAIPPRLTRVRPNAFVRKPFDLGGLLSIIQRMTRELDGAA